MDRKGSNRHPARSFDPPWTNPFPQFETPPLTDPRESYSNFAFSQVSLSDPPTYPTQSNVRQDGTQPRRFRRQARSIWVTLSLWVFTFVFIVLYSAYIYRSLLSPHPNLGRLLLSASGTNVVVTVLSQVFANAADVMIRSFLDHLRWQLAARADGVSFLAFFGLSSATDWLSVLWFTLGGGLKTLWGAVRLILPLLGIFLGSILKLQASFEYYFLPSDVQVPVFAGLIDLDATVLLSTPTEYLCTYFMGWTNTLTNVPQYATHVSLPDCDGVDCKGVILPGGLENVRLVEHSVNTTILQKGIFKNTEIIQIDHAPGYKVRYQRLEKDQFSFDWDTECLVYGQEIGDALQLCIRDLTTKVVVGWKACPSTLHSLGRCYNDTDWTRGPLSTQMEMTVYRQFTRTAYSRKDLSIVNVEQTSDLRDPVELDFTVYRAAWRTLLQPSQNASDTAKSLVSALTYGLTFALRLYDDSFPDDTNTPFLYLINWMSIPLQFMVTCFTTANHSTAALALLKAYNLPEDMFAMPEDTITVARSGRGMQRMVGQSWTVVTFIVGGLSVVILTAVGIGWLMLQREVAPRSTGVPEIDVVTRIGETGNFAGPAGLMSPTTPLRPGNLRRVGTSALVGEEELMTLTDMVREKGLDRGDHSARRMATGLRKRKIWLVGEPHVDADDSRKARALLVNREAGGDYEYARPSDVSEGEVLSPIMSREKKEMESVTLRPAGGSVTSGSITAG